MTSTARPLILLATLFSLTIQAAPRPILDKPNVIIIFLDDSGYGDFAHNGNPTISTPNISELASGGVNFTQFYTSSPACSASRYSLLTGRVPGRSGLSSWAIGPDDKTYLHPREITIAEGLKTQGYKTAIFGKWHLGNPNNSNKMSMDTLPLAHGFDEWVGTNVSHDYSDAKLIQSEANGRSPIKGYRELARKLPSDRKMSEALTGIYTEAAVNYIKANKDQPFFAYIAYNQPHLGLFASEQFKGKSRRGLLGDVMGEIDHSVGQILNALIESGIDKNTLIVFSSDNGPWVKFNNEKIHPQYGEARLHVGYAMPFRDGKGSTWEGGYRVPGIFYWPGTIAANTVERSPVSTMDVLPTIFNLTGASVPQDRSIDGRDIRSYLAPNIFHARVKPINLLYSYDKNNSSALRRGPWKLLVQIGSQTGNSYGFVASREEPLLFQVEQDISERIDRSAEEPKLVQEMLEEMANYDQQIGTEGTFWNK